MKSGIRGGGFALVAVAVLAMSGGATRAEPQSCNGKLYPQAWAWHESAEVVRQPRAATEADKLAPRIEQVRGGKVVAVYTALGSTGLTSRDYDPKRIDASGGALSRRPHRVFEDGDEFLVYPAVYRGPEQQPWIGPNVASYEDYVAKRFVVPRNVKIRGVTVGGVRPVIRLDGQSASENTLGQAAIYVDRSEGIVIENIDVDGRGAKAVGKAGVYVSGARDLTLRNMRIHGFRAAKANGVFGTVENSGYLRLEGVELFDNGGDNGPEHNIYINASRRDPGFTVEMRGSWSHHAFYGHLYKSRAQRNVLEGNYFMGGSDRESGRQAEAYLVDLPEGGEAVVRNNILVKQHSGAGSNGRLLTFGVEGLERRKHSLVVEHNTFVALSRTYDGSHELAPYFLRGMDLISGNAPYRARFGANAYVGFCGGAPIAPTTEKGGSRLGFERLRTDFTLVDAPIGPAGDPIVGTPAYRHAAAIGIRKRATIGARD